MSWLWQYILAIVMPILVFITYHLMRAIIWLVQVKRIQARVDKFSRAKSHWLRGHTDLIKGANEAAMMQHVKWASESQEGAYSMSFGIFSMLILCHPKTAKLILASSEPKGFITNTSTSYKILEPWLGNGLLVSNGAKWFRNRKLLTPAFHYNILKLYMKIFNSCTDKLVTALHSSSQNDKSVDITDPISICTLNIMRKCAFSSQEDIQDMDKDYPYVKNVVEMSKLILERIFMPPLYFDFIYKLTAKGKRFFELCSFSHSVCKEVIRKRKETLKSAEANTSLAISETTSGRCVDFLDILLLATDEDGQSLTEQEILDEVETFMFEGHDTTASALTWILYDLARHPHFQTKAQYEIDTILRDKTEVEWEDLSKIPYTTRCIKESMRVHPPVPSYDRELSKPFEISGVELLPGTIVEISAYTIHHNPDVWGQNHMDFDPDRFLPENLAKMDSHAFLPFSAGNRNCIGQNFAMNEIKTTIMKVFHRFDVSVDEGHKVEMLPVLVLRAVNGIKLHFTPRNAEKL